MHNPCTRPGAGAARRQGLTPGAAGDRDGRHPGADAGLGEGIMPRAIRGRVPGGGEEQDPAGEGGEGRGLVEGERLAAGAAPGRGGGAEDADGEAR